jgi:hypothetical protein
MKMNTLVRHTHLPSLGIGCVSKEYKTKVKVNFGTDKTMSISKTRLVEVDVSGYSTISFERYRRRIMNVKDLDVNHVILGNEVHQFVGIGWIKIGVVTEEDLKKFPRVIK